MRNLLCGCFMRVKLNKTHYQETKRSHKINEGRQLAAFPVFAEREVIEMAGLFLSTFAGKSVLLSHIN